MKVNIRKYPQIYSQFTIARLFGIKKIDGFWCSRFLEITKNIMNFFRRKDRKISIKIDDFDTWSLDHTLALIILPALIKFKEKSSGHPYGYTDISDFPGETDDSKRWLCILDEMIFAFEHMVMDDWQCKYTTGNIDWISVPEIDANNKIVIKTIEGPNHTFKIDDVEIKKIEDRIEKGLELFGKYYKQLWL